MKFTAIFVVFGFSLLMGSKAVAASCEQKAASIAASRNAQVLSVKAEGKSCKIRILIKSTSGAPKRKTVVVRK